MTRSAIVCAALLAVLSARGALAAGEFIEDIQVSRRGDEATIFRLASQLEAARPARS